MNGTFPRNSVDNSLNCHKSDWDASMIRSYDLGGCIVQVFGDGRMRVLPPHGWIVELTDLVERGVINASQVPLVFKEWYRQMLA